jgi:hypothetical protein
MAKGKKGQNRQTVISNTAQWTKEKTEKMKNREHEERTKKKEKKGKKRQTGINKTAK